MDNHEKQTMPFLAELGQLKAAMWGPIPIEPAHSFTYGHLRQRQMARGRAKMVPILVNLCMDPYALINRLSAMVTLHIPAVWPEPVHMRTAYYPWSGSHGQLFWPCKASSARHSQANGSHKRSSTLPFTPDAKRKVALNPSPIHIHMEAVAGTVQQSRQCVRRCGSTKLISIACDDKNVS